MKKILLIFLTFISVSLYGSTYYVAPSTNTPAGSDSNIGTISAPWLSWRKAITTAQQGDTVYFRGGTYYYTTTTQWGGTMNSGIEGDPICFFNYPGEVPIFDLSLSAMSDYSYPLAVQYCSWIELDSLYLRNAIMKSGNATDDYIVGFYVYQAANIKITNCKAERVMGTGFGVYASDEVLIKNCDAWNLCDSLATTLPGNDGVGFQWNSIPSTWGDLDDPAYSTRIYFEGCRTWEFSDNGFAGPGVGYVEIDNCWAFAGGAMEGSGCGIKLSNSVNADTLNPLSRVVKNSIFALNRYYGMSPNNLGGAAFNGHYYNNFLYHNGYRGAPENLGAGVGLLTYNYIGSINPPNEMYVNNISYDNEYHEVSIMDDRQENYTHEYNSWDHPIGVTLSDDDFISLDTLQLWYPRKADGSLPDIDFGKLTPITDLIDAGEDSIVTRDQAILLTYYGDAPDLGYYEYSSGPQIIADHSIVDDYDNIPQYYIDSVKKMWVSYAGESHSQAIRTGLDLLELDDSRFQVNVTESGTPEAYTDAHLRASRATWGDVNNSTGWIYSYGEEDWWTSATAIARTKAGITYANENSLDIAALGYCWCSDIIAYNTDATARDAVYGCYWFGASVGGPDGSRAWGLDAADYALTGNSVSMDTYLNATQEYIDHCTANGYNTKVFFTTGPIDVQSAYEPAYQAHVKHEYLRDYVDADTTRILFDYSDILAYDDDSETPQTATWNGYTYPVITDTNQGDETIGHIGSAGALRLGKAMWWMLARIAGWDGGVTVYSEPEEPSVDSTATDIITFTLPTQTGAATINTTNHTVAIEVSYTADITNLTPTITLSYGATIDPLSGVSQDFTSPVTYTVTALDEVTEQEWVVTVTQAEAPSTHPRPVMNGTKPVMYGTKMVIMS